jgi:hypothetical protein
MKNIILSSLIIITLNLFGQTTLSNNKEYFDFLYRYNLQQQKLDTTNSRYFGNTTSWDMIQLLNLYTTTNDKAYLVQFIHLSAITINKRFDVQNSFGLQWPPKWTLSNDVNGESTYFNTIITLPMAKFAYLVRNNLQLYAAQIPDTNIQLISQDIYELNLKYPSTTFVTYGDYADWLGARVEETMSYLDSNYWNNTVGHHKFQYACNENEITFIIT